MAIEQVPNCDLTRPKFLKLQNRRPPLAKLHRKLVRQAFDRRLFKINASPRKKILFERNEPGRTSSMSEFKVKSVSFAPAPMEDSDKHREVAPTTTSELVSKAPKPEIGVEAMVPPKCPEPVCEKAFDCVNLDPSLEISPPLAAAEASFPVSSSGQVIALLDAYLSAPPPYDPKTNYLSPRPQFLHYRPNPRVEYFLSKDGEGKRLEEGDERESENGGGEVLNGISLFIQLKNMSSHQFNH